MKNKNVFYVLLVFTFIICSASIWGSIKKVGGTIGGVVKGAIGGVTGGIGSAGDFVGKTAFGGIIGGAFEPAIAKYDASNQNSIHLLDTTLNGRLKQFNNILTSREHQFDSVLSNREDQLDTIFINREHELNDILTARENQLDEIFKTSILQADEKIKEDIGKLDESLEFRIGQLNTGLTINAFVFSSSLWITFKGVAQLGLIILLIYFILLTVSKFRNDGLTSLEKRRIIDRARIYAIIVVSGIILTIFFNPISNSFINPELKKTILDNEKNLKDSANEYDYRKANYWSYILTQLDVTNKAYNYNQLKFGLLEDLMYRPKFAIFNNQNIDELVNKMNDFEAFFLDSGSKDPEFYIINALYISYTFNNREGDALAAYLCAKSLTYKYRDKDIRYPLDIFAYSTIKNFKTHPMTQEEVIAIVNKYGVEDSKDSFADFNKVPTADSLLLKSVKFNNSFVYDELVKKITTNDEKDFLQFLEYEKNNNEGELLIIGNKFINRWLDLIAYLKILNVRQNKFAALELNDSYIRYVENHFTSKNIPLGNSRYDSYLLELNSLVENSTGELQTTESQKAKLIIRGDFSTFRQYFLCDVLSFFSAKPKIAVIISESGRSFDLYKKTKEFASKYIELILNSNNLALYPDLIDISSRIGIYQYKSDINSRPLCRELFAIFKSKQPSANQKAIDEVFTNMNQNLIFTSIKFL